MGNLSIVGGSEIVGFIISGVILVSVAVIFLLLGVIFCVVGNNKRKYCAKTTGQVVDMCENAKSFNSGCDGKGAHFGVYVTGSTTRLKDNRCPVFTYNVNGLRYTRADSVAYDIDMIKNMMQNQVDVYYNPQNPMDSKLSVRSPLRIVGVVFILVSILLLGMGISFILL